MPTYLTTQAEMERIISANALNLRLDDDEDNLTSAGELTSLDDIRQEASDEVYTYLEVFYDPDDIAQSTFARRRASIIGCYLLCQRKGHPVPGSFQKRYEQVITQLENIQGGRLQVPRLPQRAELTPTNSNMELDYRYRHRKLRVNQQTSTGQTYPDQHVNNADTYGFDFYG